MTLLSDNRRIPSDTANNQRSKNCRSRLLYVQECSTEDLLHSFLWKASLGSEYSFHMFPSLIYDDSVAKNTRGITGNQFVTIIAQLLCGFDGLV